MVLIWTLLLLIAPELSLTISPRASFAPTTLTLIARARPDPRNRTLCCLAVAGEFELRRSCFPTDDRVTYQVEWRRWDEVGEVDTTMTQRYGQQVVLPRNDAMGNVSSPFPQRGKGRG